MTAAPEQTPQLLLIKKGGRVSGEGSLRNNNTAARRTLSPPIKAPAEDAREPLPILD
jgi:hypothetical protein